MLIDTHSHLHFDAFRGDIDAVLHRADEADVGKFITVGVDTADSRKAVDLAHKYQNIWATAGIHPHSADEAEQGIRYLTDLASERKIVAIGECGLDYLKSTVSKEQQELCLRGQIELAREKELPIIFHVREAFDDFFRIIDEYKEVRGVVHCFSSTSEHARKALDRGFYIALNGIMTFTKDEDQLAAAKLIPLDRLLLETDCPYLAPAPNRGKRNEPAAVADIASFLSELRGEKIIDLTQQTSRNAHKLFKI